MSVHPACICITMALTVPRPGCSLPHVVSLPPCKVSRLLNGACADQTVTTTERRYLQALASLMLRPPQPQLPAVGMRSPVGMLAPTTLATLLAICNSEARKHALALGNLQILVTSVLATGLLPALMVMLQDNATTYALEVFERGTLCFQELGKALTGIQVCALSTCGYLARRLCGQRSEAISFPSPTASNTLCSAEWSAIEPVSDGITVDTI